MAKPPVSSAPKSDLQANFAFAQKQTLPAKTPEVVIASEAVISRASQRASRSNPCRPSENTNVWRIAAHHARRTGNHPMPTWAWTIESATGSWRPPLPMGVVWKPRDAGRSISLITWKARLGSPGWASLVSCKAG